MAGPALQVRFPTSLTDEEYVSQRAWNDASAPPCPWCRTAPHPLAPHGFYQRVKPAGTLIRRFVCRQMDQVDRRLLQGEKIPHGEKVFSVFEEHTRWVSKDKAGRAVELGVPVCIVEDQHQFVLRYEIEWAGDDTDVAVPLVGDCLASYPELASYSFDKGFHSPANRAALDGLLELNALPRKGRLSGKDKEREGAQQFVQARQQHRAVESAIDNLERRGLDRVRTHGKEGFQRTVAPAVAAANLHRIGLILQRRERDRFRLAA